MTDRIRLGEATVTRVVETQIEMRTSLFAGTPAEAWAANADLLEPDFWNRDAEQWRITMQIWVVEVDGLTVVIDTGVGNDRHRPHMPPLDHLSTNFLADFLRAGFDPAGVDVVINTHLHTDHVGWNTHLVDGAWVPTFPNARYVMPEADLRYFGPDGPGHNDAMANVFADSVIPVDAQIEPWANDLALSESLRLRPAAGHTPGSSVLWLDAGKPAVFVGDLTHCPIQIPRPDDPCAFDVDSAAAAATRKRVFTEASRSRAFVIPAHYPGHGGTTLVARGDRFAADDWLDLPRI
ncbi:MBL fold metallo-hydrolase [Mycolicibacterium hodleri]|uniref:MBL fold metallo-hydrolase n=1 Tax=Mycolicibacterium hodleri TaxID=49897 RepID=A0A502DWE1_9MYCO|nr:MBL fold metallo-hydrolase [Mycolicibacterium hodleri]TPG29667.1 MBL fold metallo-hydrolase [Mycolicibacterium hodleri]